MEVLPALVLLSVWIPTTTLKILSDAKSTYYLEFINFILFDTQETEAVTFTVSKQTPLYSSFELEKLPKDFHRVVPYNHWGLAQMSVF